MIKRLGQQINNLLLGAFVLENRIFSSNAVAYKMVLDIDMLISLIYGGVLSSAITKHEAMYYASHDKVTTIVHLRDLELTAPLPT
eukprot:IDg1661t1